MMEPENIIDYDTIDNLRFKMKVDCAIGPDDEPGEASGLALHIFKVHGRAWIVAALDDDPAPGGEPVLIKAETVLLEKVEFKPISDRLIQPA